MEHCRLQIGCLLIVVYIGFIYIRECKRYHIKLSSNIFYKILILSTLSIPMQKCILFGNSEHPFPEKQSIPFRSRVQLMISTQMESLFHVM